jgi:UDP-3-O-[3-hydroxymyristoyl] N-acetylglucosamine deacetylase
MPAARNRDQSPATVAQSKPLISFTGKGITSKRNVSVDVEIGAPGQGVVFAVPNPKSNNNLSSQSNSISSEILIQAKASNVLNVLRNVVVGKDGARLCFVEHFLAAASLWGLNDLTVHVDGPEMPLGDGSALIWIELFERSGIARQKPSRFIEIPSPIVVGKKDKMLLAIPDDQFSVTYLMDWKHPLIGKRWQEWKSTSDILDVARARTFGQLEEHKLLGLENDVVSLTEDGFSQPLRFEDEPVRHKLLDIIGDLTLSGVNPLSFKARFISIKAGHELDVEMARQLEAWSLVTI